jgi:hypothetical protein
MGRINGQLVLIVFAARRVRSSRLWAKRSVTISSGSSGFGPISISISITRVIMRAIPFFGGISSKSGSFIVNERTGVVTIGVSVTRPIIYAERISTSKAPKSVRYSHHRVHGGYYPCHCSGKRLCRRIRFPRMLAGGRLSRGSQTPSAEAQQA